MKLEKIEGHENYACTVVKLTTLQDVVGLDKLKKVTVFGNDVLVNKDSDTTKLYLFFPSECAISTDYLSLNNEFRESTLNTDRSKKGFFEPTGRVKAIKFKGVISSGYLSPLESLKEWYDTSKLRLGDEFNMIEGTVLCKKYKVVRTQATTTKESRFNKKLKRFDKLVPNQFRFHESTSHLAKNLHQFKADNIIVITDKWHGTSAVFSNVLIKKELSLIERLAKFFGVDVVTTKYDNLYSSRSVIKNQYINKEQGGGYYGEDIWAVVNSELKDKVAQGITLYGEIVGYLKSGKEIQKGYDYGCSAGFEVYAGPMDKSLEPKHKFLVYRITYTKPDGNTIEYSWQQIKDYCKANELEHVKEIYFGVCGIDEGEFGQESFLRLLQEDHLEKDCGYCTNKVPAEGVCIRIDGKTTYSTFKLKSKRFLEHETKALDSGTVDIEEEQAA